ncbi:type II toxin-antitoxin system RelE/ParE family toxin [Ekhidna sp.]|uniref:type II toxin-antitoxin system RelE/ParE family toxin n=1 Tax=Ekhidna sp. TaxID=2608089 RepID=UPI003B5AF5E1
MIETFKNKELEKFFKTGDGSKLNQANLKRIRRILFVLNNAKILEDINLPGWRLHSLKGKMKGHYAVDVSGNFRIIFRFNNSKVTDVDYLDYH